jgi:hypothetical protein
MPALDYSHAVLAHGSGGLLRNACPNSFAALATRSMPFCINGPKTETCERLHYGRKGYVGCVMVVRITSSDIDVDRMQWQLIESGAAASNVTH